MITALTSLKQNVIKHLDRQLKILLKNSSWVFVANFVAVCALFLQSVLLARFLGPKIYGVYVLIEAILATIEQTLNLNVGTAIIRFVTEYKEKKDYARIISFLKLAILIIGLCSFGFLFTVIAIGNWSDLFLFEGKNYVFYIFLFALGRALGLFDAVNSSLLQIYDRFKINSIIRITLTIIDITIIALALFYSNGSLQVLLLAFFLSNLISAIIRNLAAYWELRDAIRRVENAPISLLKKQSREIRNFILHNSLSKTIKTIHVKVDVLILGTFVKPELVGIYAIAKKLSGLIVLIIDPLRSAIYPQIMTIVANKQFAELKEFIKSVSLKLGMVIVTGTIVVVLFGKEIINLLYGSEYQSAFIPMLILIIGINYNQLGFWTVPMILSLNLTGYRLKIDFINVLFGMTLAFVLVPYINIFGSAIALSFTYFFAQTLLFLRLKKHLIKNE